MDESIMLQMEHIDKRFPGVHALNDCEFSLRKGEVHALIGENGAGKSTLVKIMTGIYTEYDGDYYFDGKKVHFNSIKDAQAAGVFVVHQELNMMNELTVAQNLFIGRESKGFFCSDRTINRKTEALIREFDIGVRPTDKLSTLTIGKAQMVEIARAMSFDSTKVLILDEPTAALSQGEVEELFKKIQQLKDKGVSIVFISHRLGEIMRIADRVTVMRDGAYIDTLDIGACTVDDIIRLMVGREIIEQPKQKSNVDAQAPVILEAQGLRATGVYDVSFQLKKGEILGFAGLVGAGRTEVMRLLCGADRCRAGTIRIKGRDCTMKHPHDGVEHGVGYLSEDRKRYGLVLGLSVNTNTMLASYDKVSDHGLIRGRDCERHTNEYVRALRIKTPSIQQMVKNLSGGNQQKVVVGKWLFRDVDILIFDEPTRGIDVGARAEIYQLMDELVQEGKAIIMVSSDLTEILKMSDRIIVMCEGRITADLDIQDADQERIMMFATKRKEEVPQ